MLPQRKLSCNFLIFFSVLFCFGPGGVVFVVCVFQRLAPSGAAVDQPPLTDLSLLPRTTAVIEVRQNEGTPCTATVSGSKRDGVCNAAGQCSISVPPNENFRVRTDQCA